MFSAVPISKKSFQIASFSVLVLIFKGFDSIFLFRVNFILPTIRPWKFLTTYKSNIGPCLSRSNVNYWCGLTQLCENIYFTAVFGKTEPHVDHVTITAGNCVFVDGNLERWISPNKKLEPTKWRTRLVKDVRNYSRIFSKSTFHPFYLQTSSESKRKQCRTATFSRKKYHSFSDSWSSDSVFV